MTENERLELRIKAKIIYKLMTSLHTEICRLTDRGDALSEDSCDICCNLIELRKKLGEFDNDRE